MKTKYLFWGVVIGLLALGGWTFGRAEWRARRQLVSMDVRNAPLAEVLRQIERQTRQKIPAEAALANVRVTLRVENRPLAYVLDWLAEQAGARWTTVHAVYHSKAALKSVETALWRGGQFPPSGWTKVAPHFPDMKPPEGGKTEATFPPGPPPGGPGPGPMKGTKMLRRGPGGPVTFQSGPDGGMEMWSPEELVVESTVTGRLGYDPADGNNSATATAAAEAARKVQGDWKTYLAFRKSNMGVGFGAVPAPRLEQIGPGGEEGPKAPGALPMLRPPDPSERFARLTPEQRVQRARQRHTPVDTLAVPAP